MTDADYLAAWHQVVLPLAAEFQPDLVVIISIVIIYTIDTIIASMNIIISTINTTNISIQVIRIIIVSFARFWCRQDLTPPWDVLRANKG